MLRRDFISKIIEQMVNAVARLLNVDYEKETEKFLDKFDELLTTYFELNHTELKKLLKTDEKRDALLLDEKLKNFQLQTFARAGLAYLKIKNTQNAKDCLEIISRIQHQHSDVFEFPNVESIKLSEEIKLLSSRLNNLENTTN